ncbi:MAG: ATP-binding protein [Bullifex sp.]
METYADTLMNLVLNLCSLPAETEYAEFKHNNYDPDMIGKDISALANSACLLDRENAYMVWGIDDQTHSVVGTEHTRFSKLRGCEEISSFLRRSLSANAHYDFDDCVIDGKAVVVLTIERSFRMPVTFNGNPYIRIGSYTKPLKDYPDLQSQLWKKLSETDYELLKAKTDLTSSDVFSLLDFSNYFILQGLNVNNNPEVVLNYALSDDLISKQDNGLYSITNLGALLFAINLRDFPSVRDKRLRVIVYADNTKAEILKDSVFESGYALVYSKMTAFLDGVLPSKEVIGIGLRTTEKRFPERAVREVISNAMIHQDLSVNGQGISVEVFSSRIEVTNPGCPIVDPRRFIDNPPKSRNIRLADLMRRMRMCEIAGSGWDRITMDCEKEYLPTPTVSVYDRLELTKVTVLSFIAFSSMTKEDKLWSCYSHACITYVNGEVMSNATLRARFGLDESYTSQISRLIRDASEAGLIKKSDPASSNKFSRYIPYWA